jgi:hypothetical protein
MRMVVVQSAGSVVATAERLVAPRAGAPVLRRPVWPV